MQFVFSRVHVACNLHVSRYVSCQYTISAQHKHMLLLPKFCMAHRAAVLLLCLVVYLDTNLIECEHLSLFIMLSATPDHHVHSTTRTFWPF
jgi:hypothetical protein